MSSYIFDWADIAFGSKKEINSLKPIFIAAPREMSEKRFTQLIKTYLLKGNLVLGLAKEPYIAGFEGQPQFSTLQFNTIKGVIDKVNTSKSPHKIYSLTYYQRETAYVFEKIKWQRAVLVNGSWLYAFHTQKPYYILVNKNIPFEYVSPFSGEDEARTYEMQKQKSLIRPDTKGVFSESQIIGVANEAAKASYDYNFQTGVALGRKNGKGYEVLATAHNAVVPFETYALHYGASREQNYSPPNDLNHYDTVHAEVGLILRAQKEKIDLKNSTLFINLLPCPVCSRMLSQTDISEVVYQQDHSDGYAVKILEAAGKTVRRVVP
jgi:dCMP deaminase